VCIVAEYFAVCDAVCIVAEYFAVCDAVCIVAEYFAVCDAVCVVECAHPLRLHLHYYHTMTFTTLIAATATTRVFTLRLLPCYSILHVWFAFQMYIYINTYIHIY